MKRIIFTNDRKLFLRNISCIFVFFFVFFSVFAPAARAAEISFDAKTNTVAVGQQFQVSVVLDTSGEEINAVEGKILFPSDLLALKEVSDANSIINFWVEKPHQIQGAGNKEQGEIAFSGIIPGGYQGQNGLLLSLIFVSKKEGQGTVELQEAKTLLNDGNGTEAPLTISPYQSTISWAISAPVVIPTIDKEPPESFVPEIARDPTLYNGKWFAVFATQDKGLGVDHYEVKETRSKILGTWLKRQGTWIRAESPYVLKDQELRSYVFVKAVDKAGNERIVKILPQNPLKWYENYENWIMIVVGVLVAVYITRIIRRKKYLAKKP